MKCPPHKIRDEDKDILPHLYKIEVVNPEDGEHILVRHREARCSTCKRLIVFTDLHTQTAISALLLKGWDYHTEVNGAEACEL